MSLAGYSAVAEVQAEYTRRLEQRRNERDLLAREDVRIGNGRLCVAAVFLVIAWAAFGAKVFSGWWLAAPVTVFLALVVWHEGIVQKKQKAERAVAFYRGGLERLEDSWAGKGTSGVRFAEGKHPYAGDLDLFGRGSLFELLCTARTSAGEERLADWLLHPASPQTIRARHEAITELKPRLDMREELALLGEAVRSTFKAEPLVTWGAQPILQNLPQLRRTALLLAMGTAASAGVSLWLHTPIPVGVLLLVTAVFERSFKGKVKQILHGVDKPAHELNLLVALLARLEREPFASPLLKELHGALATDGVPASAQIERLQTLLSWLEMRTSAFTAVLFALFLGTTQTALAIENWRAHNGPQLARWVNVTGEFEALFALAGFAYEHPGYPFPEISAEGASFEAEALAHPLIPAVQAVPNDFVLSAEKRLYIVSGSNMSGKSTLLRTIGINVVLALAGAPVCARRLRLTPFQIGASIRTQDSLQEGISRFYAEITRLRQIVDLAGGEPPLLFLLDEILHGTNSHDRRVGAEAIARTLAARGALGLLTTHDLALARIAEDPTLSAVNVHFEDQLEHGKMTFDYRLRPGIVEKSNAIELMRAVGLEV